MSVLVASLALVSGVLSAITTAIVTSIIMWCVMKKRYKHPQSTSGCGKQYDKSGTHELTSVVYNVPALKEQQNQTISTQDSRQCSICRTIYLSSKTWLMNKCIQHNDYNVTFQPVLHVDLIFAHASIY